MDRGGPLSVPSRMILCFRTRRTHSDGTRETGPETRKPALPSPSTARYKAADQPTPRHAHQADRRAP